MKGLRSTTIALLLLTVLQKSECRVQFSKASIYDEFDFKGENRVAIPECSNVARCAIFVSISKEAKYKEIYDKIQMSPAVARTWNYTLNQFAALRNAATKEIDPYFIVDGADNPSSETWIYNDNVDKVAAPLVLYAVDLSKDDFTPSVFDAADVLPGVSRGEIVTVISADPFTMIVDVDTSTVATVYMTGFDNAVVKGVSPDQCRSVLQNTVGENLSIQINGPIASIVFSDTQGALKNSANFITTALAFSYDNLQLQSHGFMTSQGFIGCKTGQVYRSSLYKKNIQFILFTDKSQSIELFAAVDSDDDKPLSILSDNNLNNFIANTLTVTESACVDTHMLTVNFDQNGENSFVLWYSMNDPKCGVDGVITTSSRPDVSTTSVVSEIFSWSMALVLILAVGRG